MSETKKYRSGRSRRSSRSCSRACVATGRSQEVCREHEIAENALLRWRDKLLEGGRERLAGKEERTEREELRRQVARARAGAWAQDLRAGDRGGSIARLGVSVRVARSRELVARGHRPAVVARVLQVSRQAVYRIPKPRGADAARRPPVDDVEAAIVEVAEHNPTDGYRIVDRLGQPEARPGGQPQAGAAGDARAQADPAPPRTSPGAGGPGSSWSSGPASYGTST